MLALGIRPEHMIAVVALWILSVPALFGYTQSHDYSHDPVLKYMCSLKFGAMFWKDLNECDVVLNDKFLSAIKTCIPSSTEEESESTRTFVCSQPEKWAKIMECVNNQLIQLQDDKNTDLEISPSYTYMTCVRVLLSEAERAVASNGSLFSK
ncbi:hypothetical protein JTE90_011227 [Oedothorax gibbosus]|uniref:Secreted protein n=1 Tax=Oedothorax gibbosus TaxID=931172 RepID=A0AAV6VX28_9ARAC|nr:hypothetical protein JTE90_011227 [Oedothorax gibbosus]